ncbi:hypothetical protein [Algoriphagus terrigena]|uniref:hypothetical protein n=1 Tax=Algoriphagus terrigena TaxID=344884 RepID=UPI000686F4F3|nr:hypothetical protein [Algoriphagus terrigena]
MKSFLMLACLLTSFSALGQTYFDESNRRIVKEDYEEKILNGPYFGVPGDQIGDMKLVHRMPVGVTDARMIYEKLGLLEEFQAGKPLIVIFYPGKDGCNSTGFTDRAYLKNKHKSLLKYAEKHDAVPPLYIYKNPHGLEKYQGIQEWTADPDQLFEKLFFQYPYPCGSFVVINPKGNFRGILGEHPISQIDVALKKL